ncbi:hypothetical protein D9758_016199 [Tetrapyrgos nigripes]|uniref:Phosphoribulokinase/uridine kinase domain-containing protein n=1 Tax=Tetrapyrgos nigripes TaxID=182062 RepID=A0A8H5FF95_9AGAR|nr:hypothetical protein D9758_016199 [Tetrapyrgos nigripes]
MSTDTIPTRIIMIGVGGATSSGKTTLAKHLQNCLHDSFIIHQDDFVPPAENLPVDPEYGFANWDDAPGAIDWDRMAAFLSDLKKGGILPSNHQSYDSFNETRTVPVDDDQIVQWRLQSEQVAAIHQEKYGEKLIWALIDGFLLYWDERIISNLDVRAFIRVPEDIAKSRREARSYHTPGEQYLFWLSMYMVLIWEIEGDVWRDPPEYWEKVVWPAYIRAHKHIFEGEDIMGNLNGKVKELVLLESTEASMQQMVNVVIEKILDFSAGTGRVS